MENQEKTTCCCFHDAWISKDLNHAKSFIDWVKSSLFYDLTYNDNDKMLKMIKDIL